MKKSYQNLQESVNGYKVISFFLIYSIGIFDSLDLPANNHQQKPMIVDINTGIIFQL